MQQELVTELQEPVFVPYAFRPMLGDCADGVPSNVSQSDYGEEMSFRLAGVLLVKHAD